MEKKLLFILVVFLITVLIAARWAIGSTNKDGAALIGQDLHLAGRELISYQIGTDSPSPLKVGAGVHILVYTDGFSMSSGVNQFSSDRAVVWLESLKTDVPSHKGVSYKTWVYLQGNVLAKTSYGVEDTDLGRKVIEEGKEVVLRLDISGEVVATAQARKSSDPRGLEFYAKAFAAVEPRLEGGAKYLAPRFTWGLSSKEVVPAKPQEKKPSLTYPINLAPAGEAALTIEWDDKAKIGTVIGRFYIWQKKDVTGTAFLELQADNAVIFASLVTRDSSLEKGTQDDVRNTLSDILGAGTVQAIYLSGDVVMTEGQRTIRADEIYYDFTQKKALAINAAARSFDVTRGIPIYVRAAKLRQLAENRFKAENVTLTTSEFYLPQISVNASEVIITDTTNIGERGERVSDSSFDAQMRDVRFKMYDKTIFYWPSLRSNLQRPDVPIKGVQIGNDNTWGTSIETQWYLARLLGLQESEGTDSTITLDYYSKRGLGSGLEINYAKEDYFGRVLGYIIDDHGEDRLGRLDSRKDLEPPQELRGRFRWQHKQFLPFNWQLATEISYTSDKNFIEQFYRREFNTDKEQETIIHLKRIEDNWGLAFLGKARLNDFDNVVEELPSAEFHWTGQSFFNDRLTFYSDSQVSRFRQRLASDSSATSFAGFLYIFRNQK